MEKPSGNSPSCPDWATEKIGQLRQLEIFLGNIPKTADWKSDHLSNIAGKDISEKFQGISEATAEMVFRQIVKQLTSEQFTPGQIATLINERVGYKGGPAYCDESEVREALGS